MNEETEVKWRIPQWFQKLSDEELAKLKIFHTELIRFNGKINLISPRTEHNADQVHFADCILGGQAILKQSDAREILDIGSGNGLPGVVMAILARDREFILLDKDARKVEFIKHCAHRLRLKNISAIQKRFEELPPDSISACVSRGFASISKTILLARKVCRIEAEYYHFKGDSWPREVAQIPSQVCAFWAPMHIEDYTLPDSSATLTIVVTKKIG